MDLTFSLTTDSPQHIDHWGSMEPKYSHTWQIHPCNFYEINMKFYPQGDIMHSVSDAQLPILFILTIVRYVITYCKIR